MSTHSFSASFPYMSTSDQSRVVNQNNNSATEYALQYGANTTNSTVPSSSTTNNNPTTTTRSNPSTVTGSTSIPNDRSTISNQPSSIEKNLTRDIKELQSGFSRLNSLYEGLKERHLNLEHKLTYHQAIIGDWLSNNMDTSRKVLEKLGPFYLPPHHHGTHHNSHHGNTNGNNTNNSSTNLVNQIMENDLIFNNNTTTSGTGTSSSATNNNSNNDDGLNGIGSQFIGYNIPTSTSNYRTNNTGFYANANNTLSNLTKDPSNNLIVNNGTSQRLQIQNASNGLLPQQHQQKKAANQQLTTGPTLDLRETYGNNRRRRRRGLMEEEDGNESDKTENIVSNPTVSDETNNSEPTTSSSTSTKRRRLSPLYTPQKVTDSVMDLVTEYLHGVGGMPSIKELETKHGSKWRGGAHHPVSKKFGRMKPIYDAVDYGLEMGYDEQSIVAVLDKQREVDRDGTVVKKSITWLQENIPSSLVKPPTPI